MGNGIQKWVRDFEAAQPTHPGTRWVEGEVTVADVSVEWCDVCHSVHAHARVYVSPVTDPTRVTPGVFRDCTHEWDHLWQE